MVQKNGTNSCIVSVSLPILLKNWLDETEMSASQLFQDKLIDEKRHWDLFHSGVKNFESEITRLEGSIDTLFEFLSKKSLREEFLKWRNEKNVLEKNKIA